MKVVILSAALILAPMLLLSGPQERWRVDGSRLNGHLQTLRRLVTEASGEASRIAFSDADRTARSYVINLMRTAGLETHIDPAGNIIGRREGRASDLPPLMLGSHIDSVPNGGLYDGPLGVMAAIEVAHILYEHKYVTRHPLEIVVFQNEEGGKTGSRLLSGEVMDKEFDLVTSSGKTIRDGIRYIGGDPERLEQVRRQSGEIAAYLELHIEQGAVLESKNISIGVVEGIVGIKRWNVSVEGFANHAGTTPMDKRQDALLAAARFIEAVNKIVTETPGRQVGTVGRIQAFPGAPNVIPGKVSLSLELRDLDMGKIDRLFRQIASAGQNIAQGTGTSFNFDHFYTSRAALTHTRIRQLISEAAAGLGLSAMPMPSGAGHDAQSIAQFAPIGMIFIPSVDGISHSPKEFSRPQDINDGANVLLYTTLAVDAAFE
ncbi:MAG: Zn-dependent hydrolase [bacterium]